MCASTENTPLIDTISTTPARYSRITSCASPARIDSPRLGEDVPVGQAVQRPQQQVERPAPTGPAEFARVPVRLAQLRPAEDPEFREPLPAPLDRLQIAGGVERRRRQVPVRIRDRGQGLGGVRALQFDPPHGVVQVLGECDRRQPELQSPSAGAVHVAHPRVPRPLAVHVAVPGQRPAHHVHPRTIFISTRACSRRPLVGRSRISGAIARRPVVASRGATTTARTAHRSPLQQGTTGTAVEAHPGRTACWCPAGVGCRWWCSPPRRP